MSINRKMNLVLTAAASAVSVIAWAYRLTQDYWRPVELWFYAALCFIPLVLLALTLYLVLDRCWWKRALGIVMGIPFVPLWMISILTGFYGLKIH